MEKLNKEQEKLMYEVRDEWLNRLFSCETQIYHGKIKEGIEWMYELSGFNKPMIIQVDSPYACQMAANYLNKLLGPGLTWDQVGDQVMDQVWGQVEDQVMDQVWGQVRNQVMDQVGGQVWGQVGGQVRNQVWGQVGGQVRNQVRNQVMDQVGGQVWGQVMDQVGGQVWDQVGGQVRNQVWGQVGGQVRNQVMDQVMDQVGGQVWGQVGGQVRNQVWGQVRNQVWGQVGGQVRNQVRNQVMDQVWDQELEFYSFSHYGSVSDYGWLSFYDFFSRVGIFKHDGFEKFITLIKSGVYDMIQMRGVCVYCSLPCEINRNSHGLHNTKNHAIKFNDGYCLNYVNGRYLEKDLFDKAVNLSLSLSEFNTITNEDQRAAIITIIKENFGNEGLLSFLKVEVVDVKHVTHENGYSETLKLYRTKEGFVEANDMNGNQNQPYAWINMTCPSTGQSYLISTCPTFNDVVECAKWHRPTQVPKSVDYKWMSAN